MVFSILDSMELLECGMRTFADRCIRGLCVNRDVNARHTDTLIPLLTRLTRERGYSQISALCKEAGNDRARIRALLATRTTSAPD